MKRQRVAVITGAAGEIGMASTQQLAELNCRVVLVDRDKRVEEIAERIGGPAKAKAFVVDLQSEQQIGEFGANVVREFGGIDILVNNAGIHPKKDGRKFPLDDISLDQWQQVLFLNLTVPFLLYQIAAPGMRENGWGRIVNISSLAGRTISSLAAGHYAASKAGLIGLTRVMAFEGARHGITANCVAPGPIATALTTPLADVRARVAAAIPVGRYGTAQEVASAVRYFATDEAGFVTGAILDVSGGAFMP